VLGLAGLGDLCVALLPSFPHEGILILVAFAHVSSFPGAVLHFRANVPSQATPLLVLTHDDRAMVLSTPCADHLLWLCLF